jgi:proteasome component ECM29
MDKTYLSQPELDKRDPSSMLVRYLHASFSGLVDEDLKHADRTGRCLLELCSLAPRFILEWLVPRINELKPAILGSRHPTRVVASHVFGILAISQSMNSQDAKVLAQSFQLKIQCWQEAIGSQVHEVHGAILALAYWFSRRSFIEDYADVHAKEEHHFLDLVLTILTKGRDRDLIDASIQAVDQFCLYGAFRPNAMPKSHEAFVLFDKLKERAETGDEKAVYAIGHLAMQCEEDDDESSMLSKLINSLYGLHEKKLPELQFAVGSALSCAAIGWQSKTLVGLQDVGSGSFPRSSQRSSTLASVLNKVLEYCKGTKPALRQASVIWLLCLVQYCGHIDVVKDRLGSCQVAFKGFLADRESLNQETASRGLSMVYEKGDRDLKNDLIKDLVGSFTGTSTGLAGNVSGETQLFEPGALPTGDGSITTYKDIMSLAAEVGDSSLVYRFMSLASNNAIWSSRAAFGRFGLSNILSDSSVDGYMSENPKLYSALYRYRFDPNSNVRSAMNDIWSALVKDPNTVIESHFENIMEDLLKNMLGREWRTRQASCAAVADLIQGRRLEKYEKYLTRIWTLTFKVGDGFRVRWGSLLTSGIGLRRY